MLLVELLDGRHRVGHAEMLAPVLGGDHRVRDEFTGEADGVVGEPLGAQVQADGPAAFGNGAELRLVVPGLAVLGNAGLVVHAELDPVDLRAACEQAREPGGVVGPQDLRGQALDQGLPVFPGVLGPDAESEVQAAPAGLPGYADQHLQVPRTLLGGEADRTDLGKPGDFEKEGIGRGQVGDLVAEGEAQVVCSGSGQAGPGTLPRTRRRRTRSPRAAGCRGTTAYSAKSGAGTRPREGWMRKRPLPAKRARQLGQLQGERRSDRARPCRI